MDEYFERYERDYVRRLEGSASAETRVLTVEEQRMEAMRAEAGSVGLDSWDYAVLEMVRRWDVLAPLKVGTIRHLKSMLRLYCQGMITFLNRKPEFDERERMQAFFDSPAYKQYEERLGKIMDSDTAERVKLTLKIMGCDTKLSFMERITGPSPMKHLVWHELTEKGAALLKEKRSEALGIHQKMEDLYGRNKREFHSYIQDRSPDAMMLPMMLVMGFANGAMMSLLMNMHAGSEYAALSGEVQYLDSFGEIEEHGSGFDGGDSSFDVGF